MGTNYIAPMWRMPENTNKDKLSNYSLEFGPTTADVIRTNTTWQTDVGLDNVKKVSFSVWVNPNSGTGSSIMAVTSQAYGTWNGNFNITYRADISQLALEFRGAGSIFTNNSTTLAGDTWHHICFVLDLTLGGTIAQEVRCFVNNSEVANQSSASPPLNFVLQTTSFNIGRTLWGSGGSGYQWQGKIAQACFFDYTLSESQIEYLYDLNNPMVPGAVNLTAPVAYWPLGDNSNPNAPGSFPNISVGADSVFEFAGTTSSKIDIESDTSYSAGGIELSTTQPYTISAWVNLDSTSLQTIISGQSPTGSKDWTVPLIIYQVSGTYATIQSFREDSASVSAQGNNILRSELLNTWHHIMVVRDGVNCTFYYDGKPNGSDSFSSSNQPATIKLKTIGKGFNNWVLNGKLTNLQVWQAGLTASEALTLYNNGQPLMSGTQPQEANLKAWYKLNQSSNWEADSVGNWQIPDATSAFPQSFNFIQANSDAIDVGLINLGTENSISFWYNFNDSGSTQTVIGGSGNNQYIIQFGGNYIAVRPDAGSDVFYSPYFTQIRPPYKTQGVWGHYLITRNGNTIRLFINGDEKTMSGTGTGMGDTLVTKIGSNNSGGFYANAEISNVAFWDSDQSSEKDSIYNDGTPATSYTNTPQYWYKLDNTAVWNPAPANYWTFPNAGTPGDSGTFNFSN